MGLVNLSYKVKFRVTNAEPVPLTVVDRHPVYRQEHDLFVSSLNTIKKKYY